jgi:DNA-binding beta-propeller fold protein YncE
MRRSTVWKGNQWRQWVGGSALAAAVLGWGTQAGAGAPENALFATVDATPGYPQGIAAGKHQVYVAGPAMGAAGTGPSEIEVRNRNTGGLIKTIKIEGENLEEDHALHGIAVDGRDRIYVLSTQLGLVRIAKVGKKHVQSVYAGPFPDMPPCSVAAPGEGCSPTDLSLPPEPADITFAPDGTAYVTDAQQATIYRIPPEGGAPEIWLQSSKLAGFFDLAGVSAIRTSPDGKSLYVTVPFSTGAPWEGRIFAIPRIDAPTEADIEEVHTFTNFEAPEGLAVGEGGALYVALSVTNELAVVEPGVGETARIGSPKGSNIPFDGPARIAFDGRGGLYVTNLAAVSNVSAHFAVLRVPVGDRGADIWRPKLE